MLLNLNDLCLKGLKLSTPYLSMILINFPLHVSSHFSIALTILLAQNETGKISEIIALTGNYQNMQR